jgi:nucleotide-binding universal stress UspA family protein
MEALKMEKLLVPVDGSECSMHALAYAASRQRTSPDIEIIVLHVQPSMRPSRVVTRELIAEYQDRNSKAALKPARAIIKRSRLDATCHILIGDPARTIVQFSEKKKCTEVVIGNSGLGAVAGLVLGSVARKVLHLAQTPVVLVK